MFPNKQITFLSHWFTDVTRAELTSLGVQGGFSGAVIWRVSREGRELCLRRWPQGYPTTNGLLAIHGLLQHVGQHGCDTVPVPLPTREGNTFVVDEDYLWELTPWMPGEADYCSKPSPTKLTTAMHALANFHSQAQSYTSQGNGPLVSRSPGLLRRLELLQSLQQGELERLWKATRAAEASDLREVAFELLEGITRSHEVVANTLTKIVNEPLPLQWCLRDVRHDHLLFTEEKVTGLIDFGAASVDSVSCDIARLLGSMVNDHSESWQAGIESYSQVRPLSDQERQAMAGFDEGGALCSAANWVRWLFVEGRTFPQVHALHAQLVWLRNRLEAIAERSGASSAAPAWKPAPHTHLTSEEHESRWMHT